MKELGHWNKMVFGNVNKNIKSLTLELQSIQQRLVYEEGFNQQQALALEASIRANLNHWLEREKVMWAQMKTNVAP